MSAAKSGDPGFSMLPLLIHSEAVPAGARSALMQAQTGSAEQRIDALVAAARVLHHETGLECRDVLEIIGLEAGSCS
jgi:hypothetical protein